MEQQTQSKKRSGARKTSFAPLAMVHEYTESSEEKPSNALESPEDKTYPTKVKSPTILKENIHNSIPAKVWDSSKEAKPVTHPLLEHNEKSTSYPVRKHRRSSTTISMSDTDFIGSLSGILPAKHETETTTSTSSPTSNSDSIKRKSPLEQLREKRMKSVSEEKTRYK